MKRHNASNRLSLKKLFAFLLIASTCFSSLISQEADANVTSSDGLPEGFIYTLDFVMEFEGCAYINPEYKELNSGQSPINFQPSIGVLWPNYSWIAVQPSVSFFYMNHLWYEDRALPAEIENRTSTTFSFLINLPAVFSIILDTSRFQFSIGPSALLRFATLASGISAEDTGYLGSAAADVEAMNNWFAQGGRWFYISAGIDWLYHLTPQLRAGPVLKANIPLGSLITDKSAQGMLFSIGIKICR